MATTGDETAARQDAQPRPPAGHGRRRRRGLAPARALRVVGDPPQHRDAETEHQQRDGEPAEEPEAEPLRDEDEAEGERRDRQQRPESPRPVGRRLVGRALLLLDRVELAGLRDQRPRSRRRIPCFRVQAVPSRCSSIIPRQAVLSAILLDKTQPDCRAEARRAEAQIPAGRCEAREYLT